MPRLRPYLIVLMALIVFYSRPLYADGRQGQAPVTSESISPPYLYGVVVDERGAAIAGAHILSAAQVFLAVTDGAGRFQLAAQKVTARLGVQGNGPDGPAKSAPVALRVEAAGFITTTVTYSPGKELRIIMKVQSKNEFVTVTAYRAPLASADSPASTRILTTEALNDAAAPSLDDKLRLVPGVQLFRRSSSLVANPTSQGLSLRGLGSTAASRTLVVEDDVPLNDPYGGWIHWTEPPELSVRAVELVRGGASDLYGSSAIGGVVNVLPETAKRDTLTLLSSYGGENTADEAALGSVTRGRWDGLFSAGILRTDGYTLVAPQFRGPVDIPSNVHSQNGVVEIDHDLFATGRLFMRGTGFNEARSNGTPSQTNATRLWRYSAGGDFPFTWGGSAASGTHVSESRYGAPASTAAMTDQGTDGVPASSPDVGGGGTLGLRFYGSEEHYRQSFSAIGTGRATESLTRREHTPAQELGVVAHWTQPLRTSLLMVVGADTHDVRATDTEQGIHAGAPTSLLDTSARQRQTGVYGEVLWTPRSWTLSAGARVDHFSNFDARQSTIAAGGAAPAPTALPKLAETVFDPRIGLARHLLPNRAPHLVWSASAFRAYRAPTQNELYRTGQVGQETTLPNSSLKSERATGWETGVQTAIEKTTVRVSYFWTEVNRPITALTLSSTATTITEQRENLGQIASRGVSIDFESEPARWVALTGGYQYADATVTKFAPQPGLVGKWIPQVAHNTATAQMRFSRPRLGTLSLQGRVSGQQFDDDLNAYRLSGYFRLDAYASRDFGRHVEAFASGENVFDRAIQVGKTPILTLGTPALARFGLRFRWGD